MLGHRSPSLSGRARRASLLASTGLMALLLVVTAVGTTEAAANPPGLELSSSLHTFAIAGTSPTGVSCTDRGICVAVDYFGRVDLLSGNKSAEMASTGYRLNAVSCASAAFCMAVGEGTALEFLPTLSRAIALGRTAADGLVDWRSISCPVPDYCMAGGSVNAGQGVRTPVDATWNGIVWSTVKEIATPRSGHGAGVIASLSCVGPRFCVGTGIDQAVLQWNGNRWSYPRQLNLPDNGDGFEVSCTSASFCMAFGTTDSTVRIWNGRTWRARPSPGLPGDGGKVSCDSSTFCVATDAGIVSVWSGQRWSRARSLDAGDFFNGISCAAGFCEGIEEKGRYAYLFDPRRPPRLPAFCGRFDCTVA